MIRTIRRMSNCLRRHQAPKTREDAHLQGSLLRLAGAALAIGLTLISARTASALDQDNVFSTIHSRDEVTARNTGDLNYLIELESLPIIAIASGVTATDDGAVQIPNLVIQPRISDPSTGRFEARDVTLSSPESMVHLLAATRPLLSSKTCAFAHHETTAWSARELRLIADSDVLFGGSPETVLLRDVTSSTLTNSNGSDCSLNTTWTADGINVKARSTGHLSTQNVNASFAFQNGSIQSLQFSLDGFSFLNSERQPAFLMKHLALSAEPGAHYSVDTLYDVFSKTQNAGGVQSLLEIPSLGDLSLKIDSVFINTDALLGEPLRTDRGLRSTYVASLNMYMSHKGDSIKIEMGTDIADSFALMSSLDIVPVDKNKSNDPSLGFFKMEGTPISLIDHLAVRQLSFSFSNRDFGSFFTQHFGVNFSDFLEEKMQNVLSSAPRPAQFFLGRSLSRLSASISDFIDNSGSISIISRDPVPLVDLIKSLLTVTPPSMAVISTDVNRVVK